MVRANANPVDAYIAKQPAASQSVLHRVRRIIRRLLPDAEEMISYQIPAYKLHGEYVLAFGGWKHHWSLYPVKEALRAVLGPEAASYEFSKGTMRFPLADPVPTRLVERIVRELAKAADARRRAKAASSSRQVGVRRRTRG